MAYSRTWKARLGVEDSKQLRLGHVAKKSKGGSERKKIKCVEGLKEEREEFAWIITLL